MALKRSGLELVAENNAQYLAALQADEQATRGLDNATEAAARSISESLGDIDAAVKDTGDLYQDAAGKWRNASGRFASDAEKAAHGIDAIPKATKDAADQVQKHGSVMQGVFQGIGQGLIGLAAEGGEMLLDLGASTIDVAADFEAGLGIFSSVAGSALEEAGLSVDDFREKALQLGAETQFSAAQALDGFTELVKGGRSATQAMEEADDALNLVAAGGLANVAEGADILAKQLGVWADSGVEAADVTDLLARAANASTVDVKELHDGLLQAAGTAKATGVDYEDFVTTMATIAPSFSSAQEAGTSYRNLLVRMQPSTKEAAAAMAELNLLTEDGKSKFFDATGAFVGGEQAAALLADSLAGLSDAQRQQALQTIFGNDAMNAAVALAEAGDEGYREIAKGMELAGSAADQAAERNKGFNFALETLKGSLETLQIVVGTAVLPVLTDLANEVTEGVNLVMDFAKVVTGAEDPLSALTDALGLGSGAVGDLGKMAADIAGDHLQQLTDAWNNDVMPAIEIAQAFLVNDLMPILDNLAQVLLPAVDAALDVLAGIWTHVLVPAVRLAWNIFANVFMPIIREVTDWLADTLPPVIEDVSAFFTDTLLPAVSDVYAFIDTNLVPIFSALADVITAGVKLAVRDLVDLWEETLLPALESGADWIDDTLGPILEDLGEWLDTITGGFDGITSAIDSAVGWLQNLADAIDSLPDLPDGLMPGSPTPFERGLTQTTAAMADMIPEVRALSMSLAGLDRVTLDDTSGGGMGGTTIINNQQTWAPQMPVYTNQSPAVVADGFAVMTALASMGA